MRNFKITEGKTQQEYIEMQLNFVGDALARSATNEHSKADLDGYLTRRLTALNLLAKFEDGTERAALVSLYDKHQYETIINYINNKK